MAALLNKQKKNYIPTNTVFINYYNCSITMDIHVFVCARVWVCVCILVSVCVFVSVHVCACLCINMHLYRIKVTLERKKAKYVSCFSYISLTKSFLWTLTKRRLILVSDGQTDRHTDRQGVRQTYFRVWKYLQSISLKFCSSNLFSRFMYRKKF